MWISVLLVLVFLTVVFLTLMMVPCHVVQDSIGNAVVDAARSGQQTSFASKKDQQISKFFDRLQHYLRQHNVGKDRNIGDYVIRQCLRLAGQSSTIDGDWLYNRMSTKIWWENHGKAVRESILQAIPCPESIEDVVVHMRFGDVPFGELEKPISAYHLQTYSYYQEAFEQLGIQPNSKVVLVYSTRWRSQIKQQEASEAYVEAWVQHFSQRFTIVKQSSSSPLVDFTTMVYARKLIGSGESFAFVAGIGREDHEWRMSMLGEESAQGYDIISERPVWMSSTQPLLHSKVREARTTYLDVPKITLLLSAMP